MINFKNEGRHQIGPGDREERYQLSVFSFNQPFQSRKGLLPLLLLIQPIFLSGVRRNRLRRLSLGRGLVPQHPVQFVHQLCGLLPGSPSFGLYMDDLLGIVPSGGRENRFRLLSLTGLVRGP